MLKVKILTLGTLPQNSTTTHVSKRARGSVGCGEKPILGAAQKNSLKKKQQRENIYIFINVQGVDASLYSLVKSLLASNSLKILITPG